jgi:iron complex outermembrane receptor protein
VTDFSSLDIPFVAPVQANLDATYNWPLSNGALLSLNANVVYQDEAETAPFDTNGAAATPAVIRHPTNTQIEEKTIVNANVTYRDSDDRYHLTLYGRNLTDENTRIGSNSVADLWVMSFFSAPREIGFRIGANF